MLTYWTWLHVKFNYYHKRLHNKHLSVTVIICVSAVLLWMALSFMQVSIVKSYLAQRQASVHVCDVGLECFFVQFIMLSLPAMKKNLPISEFVIASALEVQCNEY